MGCGKGRWPGYSKWVHVGQEEGILKLEPDRLAWFNNEVKSYRCSLLTKLKTGVSPTFGSQLQKFDSSSWSRLKFAVSERNFLDWKVDPSENTP